MEREIDDSRERIDDHEGRLMQQFRDDQAAEQSQIDAAKKNAKPETPPPSVAPSRVDDANNTAQSVPQEWATDYEIRREQPDGGRQNWSYYRDGKKQFTDAGTRIVSHESSEKATRDYVSLVKERYGENIKLTGGSPERQDAIMREMARQGVKVGNPELRERYDVIASEVRQQANGAKPAIYEPPKNATPAQRAQDAAHILATSPDGSFEERQRARRVAGNLEKRLEGQPTLASLRESSGIKYDEVEMRVRARVQAPGLLARVKPSNAGPPLKPDSDPKPARPRHAR